ncbi:hypothetical protein V8Z69_07480 [Microbacterium aurugineum]|uniref:hypothetical protein n=1 Tax=Microbacterium aurugineum TaxID=2851642 RepID=UPI0039BE0B10
MMGGLVIDTIRPGVQFTPDAAKAYRRAEAQLGRDIDTNSTLRARATQLRMYNAWQAYVTGRGPYPGHSKALHPDDPLAFHTKGTALDSDDWTDPKVVAVLAENGFIRNRLYIKGEEHHFEYLRDRDRNYGKPIPTRRKTEREIDMRVIFNTQDKNDETRRAVVGELTFHVQGPGASKNERNLWGDVVNVDAAGWKSALDMVNTRRAMNGLKPLRGIRGETPTPNV